MQRVCCVAAGTGPEASTGGNTMKKTERTKEKAVDAFVDRVHEIRELLDIIRAAADEHFEVDPENVNWGHVGNVAHIASELRDVVAFIRNEER